MGRKILKKTLASFLSLLLIVSALWCGVTTMAAGEIFEYTVTNGEAEITGINGSIEGKVTFPSNIDGYPVTSIGDSAFENRSKITSIDIPEGVVSIGTFAFYGCTGITSINIPASLANIGESAFYNAVSLKEINVAPENKIFHSDGNSLIETESKSLVLGCKNSVIPDDGSVTSIGPHAFSGRTDLERITIPDSITSIQYWAFAYCGSLVITIPESVDNIQFEAFYGTSVTIAGKRGTYAEQYAKDTGASFIDLDLQGITVIPTKTLMENTDGYDATDNAGKDFYYYSIDNTNPEFIVSYNDGTEKTYQTRWELEEDTGFYISYTDNQYDKHWDVGVHTVTANFMGATCDFEVEVVESPVESISVVPTKTLIENVDGYTNMDWETNTEYFNYYIDSSNPVYTVKYNDGNKKTYTNQSDLYNDTGYWPSFSDNQYDEHWGIGVHTVAVNFMGATCDFEVEVAESPVESISVVPTKTLIENADGYNATDYAGEDFYCYSIENANPLYTVRYKNGTEKTYTNQSDLYDDTGYWPSFSDNQYDEHWGIGVHTVAVNFMGATCEFQVEVVDNIVSFSIDQDLVLYENTDGQEVDENGFQWFRYDYRNKSDLKITVNYSDGREETYTNFADLEQATGRTLVFKDGQSADTPWSVGTHVVTVYLGSDMCRLNVRVVEQTASRIEVISIAPIDKNLNGYWVYDGGVRKFAYNQRVLSAVIKIYKTDSSYMIFNYDYAADKEIEGLYITLDSAYGYDSFLLDENGCVTFSYSGKSDTAPVVFKRSDDDDFEYILQDGKAYITGYTGNDSILDIPAEIYGYPVGGVADFGKYNYVVKQINIPDGVSHISENFFSYFAALEKLTLGADIKYVDNTWFTRCGALDSIIVSENNENYCSIDGIVYSKDATVLVAYPLGRGETYNVPDSVKNIDVILSRDYYHINCIFSENNPQFITENGVTYSADKKTIVACSPDKTGEYDMPDSVTQIKSSAFSGCTELTGVKFSENVTDIAYAAFAGCGSLTYVELPSSLKSIDGFSFTGCGSLAKIDIPTSLSFVGEGAFEDCESLQGVYIKDMAAWCGIKFEDSGFSANPLSLANNLYLNDVLVTNLVIPEGVESIGNYAFINALCIQSVTMPQSLTAVGSNAFAFCENIKNVYISDLNKWCSIEFASSVSNPLTYAGKLYLNGTLITDLVIPSGVTSVGDYAFYGADCLESAVFSYGVASVGECAFGNCQNLESVEIPSNLSLFGSQAFYGCNNLSGVYISDIAEWCEINFVDYYSNPLALAHNLYLNNKLVTDLVIPDGVTLISGYAFYEADCIETVLMSEDLKEIGNSAFKNCTSLEALQLPGSLETIGNSAFENCTSLGALQLPDSLETVGESAFAGTNISELSVNDKLKRIEDYSFSDTALTSLELPDTVTEIGYAAFYGCEDLGDISLPDSLVRVEQRSFTATEWYNSLEDGPAYIDSVFYEYIYNYSLPETVISIKDGTKVISDGAFADMRDLEEVTLPDGLRALGAYSFIRCKNLKTVNLPDSLEYIYEFAFLDCRSLASVYIPASVKLLDRTAFAGCLSLEEINVDPDNPYYSSVNGVLYNKDKTELLYCPSGKTGILKIPSTVERFGSFAFDGTKLSEIIIPSGVLEIEKENIRIRGFDYGSSDEVYGGWGKASVICEEKTVAEKYARENNISYYSGSFSDVSGDLDGDGIVSATDLVRFRKLLLMSDDRYSPLITDVNNDGEVDLRDLIGLKKLIAT